MMKVLKKMNSHISVFDRGTGNIHLTWGNLSGKKGTAIDDFRRGVNQLIEVNQNGLKIVNVVKVK